MRYPSFVGCAARGRLGRLLVGGLLLGHFEWEGRGASLRRRLLGRVVGRVVERPFRWRWRCRGRRLWVAWAATVVEVAFVIAAVPLVVVFLARRVVSDWPRSAQRLLAERTDLVWAAVVVVVVVVLALWWAVCRRWAARVRHWGLP